VRYRRYYSKRNRDGSRTVISVGPAGAAYMGFVRFFLIFAFFAWPVALITASVQGGLGWALGGVA
jgi:hypothetical protein